MSKIIISCFSVSLLCIFNNQAQDHFTKNSIDISINNSFNEKAQAADLFGFGTSFKKTINLNSNVESGLGIGYNMTQRFVEYLALPNGYFYDMKYRHNWLCIILPLKFYLTNKKKIYLESGMHLEILVKTKRFGHVYSYHNTHFGTSISNTYREEIVETYGLNICVPAIIGLQVPFNNHFIAVFAGYFFGFSKLKEYYYSERYLFKNSYLKAGCAFVF